MNKKILLILFLILFIASFIRLQHLNEIDFDLKTNEKDHWEKTYGNNYFYYATTWDNFYHLHATPTFYPSLLALSQDIFGHTKFALRIISAISGILTIFLIYLFSKNILKNENIGLIAGLMFTLSPITIQINQQGELESFILLLMFASIYFFLQKKWFKTSALLGLALATKLVALFLIPLFLFYLIYTKTNLKTKKIITCLAIIFIFYTIANPFPITHFTALDQDNPNLNIPVPFIIKQFGLKTIKHYDPESPQLGHKQEWNGKTITQKQLPIYYYFTKLGKIIPIDLILVVSSILIILRALKKHITNPIPAQPTIFLGTWFFGFLIFLTITTPKLEYYLYGLTIPIIILTAIFLMKIIGVEK